MSEIVFLPGGELASELLPCHRAAAAVSDKGLAPAIMTTKIADNLSTCTQMAVCFASTAISLPFCATAGDGDALHDVLLGKHKEQYRRKHSQDRSRHQTVPQCCTRFPEET